MSLYKNKIIITGGSGRFGNVLKKTKNKYKMIFPNKNELDILNTYLEDKANILESFSVKVEVLDEEQREINRLADMSLEHAERN